MHAISVLIFTTGYVVIASIYNYLLLLYMPYLLCPQQVLQLILILSG